MNTIRVLILEDDLETLSVLLGKLHQLEEKLAPRMIAVTIFSEYTQVEQYVNKIDNLQFDVVLLDRDCKLGGSFHVLDLNKFDKTKIVSISSIPGYNEQARSNGITRIVHKDYENLEKFSSDVLSEIEDIVSKSN